MRVVETQGSASGEDAGKADARYGIRTGVQDGLLQLASGKKVPAMIDCGACGGQGSARELNFFFKLKCDLFIFSFQKYFLSNFKAHEYTKIIIIFKCTRKQD